MNETNRQVMTWLRAAALAAAVVVIATADAQAQYRANNGNARDANNRVGSGGVNDASVDNRVGASGNQIVTGNVTGGREFRGPVGYRDAREFRDTTGFERSDRFVRDSSGARRTGPSIVQRPTAFYGSSLAEPLDTSFSPTAGASGGYVQTSVPQGGPAVGFQGVQPGRSGAYAGSLEQPPQFGGSLDVNPLFGVRMGQPFQSPSDFTRNDPLFATSGDRLRADDAAIRQMRDELNQAATGVRQNDAQQGGDQGGNLSGGTGNNTAVPGVAGSPLDAPLQNNVGAPGSGLQNQSLDSSLSGGSTNGDLTTGQGVRSRLIVPPAEQSSQYKELVRRMQNRTGDTTGQEARDFNMLRRAQEQGKKAPQPGDPKQPGGIKQPGDAPGTPAAPVRPTPRPNPGDALPPTPAEPEAGPAVPTEPLEVKSLATGVKAKGLADLITDAERLVKEQKYETAVVRFDQAARVAPNNAMLTLGRGVAQLGGGNYGQAEQAFRRAIGGEPALLMGRYDLNGMLGEERVKVLAKDLKELAVTGPKEVRPRLLLAFLAYNTGNGPDADKYVAEAVKLAPNDPVLQSMQTTWSVLDGAKAPAAPELNK